jgi:uncharacterized protein (DUF58 family)
LTPRRAWRALRAVASGVTPAGRAMVLLGVVATSVGSRLHWAELTALGGVCLVSVALAVLQLLRPRPADVSLQLRPPSTVVGTDSTAVVTVTAGRLPLVTPVVSINLALRRTVLRLPTVRRREEHVETFALAAPRRGVYTVGPVVHEVSDLLGLLRRRGAWAGEAELRVRPRTVLLESLSTGVVSDLEGAPSERLSASDLTFHALREYTPGDDLRHVHWRSSARRGGLLVRQYRETTRSHATVVLDDDPASYGGDDDFELAVSVAASIAVRAALDEFDVTWLTSSADLTSSAAATLLDHACLLVPRPSADVAAQARRFAAAAAGTSLVAVVSGARAEGAVLRDTASAFGPGPRRVLVRVDEQGGAGVEDAAGLLAIRVARLEDLAPLLGQDAG